MIGELVYSKGMPKRRTRQTVVARAVIIRRGKVLMARMKDRRWYFFPGGHVEPNEQVEQALQRELKEEIGLKVGRIRLLGAYDNHFDMDADERHNEIGLVFLVSTTGTVRALEDHLTFEWIPVSRLTRSRILPPGIASKVAGSIKTRHVFWMIRQDYGVKIR